MCLLLFTSNAQADPEFTFVDDVLILTDNNIDLAINQFKFILIEFYAHWYSIGLLTDLGVDTASSLLQNTLRSPGMPRRIKWELK